jgi:cytoskeleton protein RodZ
LIQEFRGPVNASIAPLGALHNNETGGLDTAEQAWAAVSRPALPAGESRLQISVSADSWIEITDANGQELEMDLLRGGSDKAYHGKPPFRILFGRASAVRLSMDGEPVDLTSYTQDDVAQLTWPQKLQLDNSELDDN